MAEKEVSIREMMSGFLGNESQVERDLAEMVGRDVMSPTMAEVLRTHPNVEQTERVLKLLRELVDPVEEVPADGGWQELGFNDAEQECPVCDYTIAEPRPHEWPAREWITP